MYTEVHLSPLSERDGQSMHGDADNFLSRCDAHEKALVAQYGRALTLAEIAVVLRYPSVQAAQKALARGRLPVPVSRMPVRRQWFASARRVAEVLARLEEEQGHSKEGASMV